MHQTRLADGVIWEIGPREYKSHVDKGLEFFISVKLLVFLTARVLVLKTPTGGHRDPSAY